MIKVNNLSKNFGQVQAVKSVSFEINDGDIVGFLGANGAGKTTVLRLITGYLTPDSGSIEVNGLYLPDSTNHIKKQIGYLPELNPLYGEMKVFDYLNFTANIRGISGKAFTDSLDRVINQCGLKGVLHKNISECSKGFKQRVGLAAAMIHDPKILILDEPVTGLDPNQIVEIRALIKQLGKEKLVLMSSHILQEIQATVDRIMIINEGEIVANGTSEDLVKDFMGNIVLDLELKNATKKAIETIPTIISDVTLLDIEKKDGIYTAQLEYSKSKDPREELFKYVVKNKWIILKLNAKTTNLEDIFRNLTTDNGGSNVKR